MAWREVSRDEFYRVIGPLNVTPYPQGNYPYTSLYKTPSGEVMGYKKGVIPEGKALEGRHYFLPAAQEAR